MAPPEALLKSNEEASSAAEPAEKPVLIALPVATPRKTKSSGIVPEADASETVKQFVPLIKRDWGRLGTVFWFLFAWAALLGIWELGAAQGFLNDRILPPPSQTIPYFIETGGSVGFGVQRTSYVEAVGITLARILVGLVLGAVAAMAVGAMIVQFGLARKIVFPIVQTLAPVSPVAWIPFAIALVGIGNPAAIFVVFMAIFGSMAVSAVAAFDGVPREYLTVARSLGTKSTRIWTRVILPAAAPGLMTMARMSFFAAWMAVLAGEMAGINSGLGYLIIMGQQMYNMELVMIGILTIGVVGFAIDRLMLLAQNRILWWENR